MGKAETMSEVIVIGAGFSGLVSSLLLSRAGMNVTLVEKNARVAPLLRNYDCQGFDINNGFHYLGGYAAGGALHRMFGELGLRDRLRPVPINQDGFDVFHGIRDDPIAVPTGAASVRAALGKAFPGNEAVLAEYCGELEKAFRDFDFLNLGEYFIRVDPALVDRSLADFLADRGASPALVEFLSVYTDMLLGVSATEVPFLTHLLGVGAYFLSVHTFEGGGGALAEALEAQARENGVLLRTGWEATRIESDPGRRFAGLRLRAGDGREEVVPADACISTIHPKRLLALLPDGPAFDLFARRISGLRDTRAVCLFHLAVGREAAQQIEGNYHLFHRNGSGGLQHRFTLLPDFTRPQDPAAAEKRMTALVTAWGNERGDSCPGGKGPSCQDCAPAGSVGGENKEPAYLAGLRERFVARLEEEFPDFREAYRIIGITAPCHLDRINATWNGSIYGLKCNSDRMRLTPRGPMKGLYLAGQSVIAPGIFGALVSACLASRHVLRRRTV
jgi:all-trans-retinol 13,14-reductase